jgi:SAM-dependent methyltransferase
LKAGAPLSTEILLNAPPRGGEAAVGLGVSVKSAHEQGSDVGDPVRDYYESTASTYEAQVVPITKYGPRAKEFVERHVRPGCKVLDVACGPAHLTRSLDPDVEVTGFDLADSMVASAKAGRPAGSFFVHDFHRPLPPCGPFDVVLALGCMEFCRDLPLVIDHLTAATEVGGSLLVGVVERRLDLLHQNAPTRELHPEKLPNVLMHFYSFRETVDAIEHAGLVAERYERGPGWYHRAFGADIHYGFWELRRA